jgi:serine/threonine-protein kinase
MTDISGQYLGRYYLSERLGEGGMAVVYKAYDTRLERDVAIKIIRSGTFPEDALREVLKRFEREAKSLAKLSHPNIVKVYDYGEHEASPYLVMEYLPGGTLKNILGRPIAWQDAVQLILPVARGVAYAHQRGVLHRDIKPANVLISENREPMLSDFGIAKLFEGNQATALTGSGMAIGTPEYMAPEQWAGSASLQSDLYSLGIMLYEMVAGRKPYIADTPAAILIKQATEPLPSPRKFVDDLPASLEHVLIKTLAKEPKDRYKDVSAFIDVLENLRAEVPVASLAAPMTTREEGKTSKELGVVESRKIDGSLPHLESPSRTFSPGRISQTIMAGTLGIIAIFLAVIFWSPWANAPFAPLPTTTAPMPHSFSTSPPTGVASSSSPGPTDMTVPTTIPLPTKIVDSKGVPMVLVPAGEFLMGATVEQKMLDCQLRGGNCPSNWFANDVHPVYLDAYYIDVFEVTNRRYRDCVTAGVCDPPKEITSATHEFYYAENSPYDNNPVINVNWNMAITYCQWREAQLPTDAQWEKAARSSDGRTYPWGEGLDSTYANYYLNVGDTTQVGSYERDKSPYGVYDMFGNVKEWVADWYLENYYQISPYANPPGPDLGDNRTLRGGSWYVERPKLSGNPLYSAARFGYANPTTFNTQIGFRCARDATR